MNQVDQHKSETGFDAHAHFRVSSDFMPNVHAHARRQGMTSASFMRSVIIAALDRSTAPDHRETAQTA